MPAGRPRSGKKFGEWCWAPSSDVTLDFVPIPTPLKGLMQFEYTSF